MRLSLLRLAALAAAIASTAACGRDKSAPEPPRPATVEATTPAMLTGTVAADVSIAPAVLVRDQYGRPMGGVQVTFAIDVEGGSIQTPQATTGPDGTASVQRWTLGIRAGTQRLTVMVGSISQVVFTATATPGPLTQLLQSWYSPVTASVGDPIERVGVWTLDAYQNPVSGVGVSFTVVAGGGSVANTMVISDANGVATPGPWTIGTVPGSNVLSVRVPGAPDVAPATYTVNAIPGLPATIVADVAIDSIGVVGTEASAAPAVVVRDRFGNPAEGRTVFFDTPGNPAGLAAHSVVADADGRASPGRWTLGTTAGVQRVTAGAAGVVLEFTVRAIPGPPARVLAAAGDAQRGHVSTALPIPHAARVTDQYGNAVAGVDVAAAVGDGGGSIGNAGGTSGADGLVSFGAWTLGPAFGRNTVVATASGIASPATFTAIGGGGEPAQAAVLDGSEQTAPVATTLPVDPRVRYLDADGVPVNEYPVEFRSTGGTVRATTDVDGVASAPWRLGTVAGPQQLVVAAGTLSTTVSATAVAGPPGRTTQLTGADQIQLVGTTLAVAPSVRVSDSYGNVRAGDVVTFEVSSGGGSVTGATVTTDANGVAQLGSWTLGTAEGINGVTPVVGSFRGAEVIAKAVPQSSFEITLRYLAGGGSAYAASFERAAARWRKVIIGDMPDYTAIDKRFCASSATDDSYPLLNETIDDVLIFVRIEKIDGPGKILGQAGACAVRGTTNGEYGSGIPIAGMMRLDIDDLQGLLASGRIDDVILHEMGHVLGIGSLWDLDPFFNLAAGLRGPDPYFIGPSGRAGFASAGGNAYAGIPVPIENQGPVGGGTRDAHWREAQLDVELMTGFVEPVGLRMPLSLTTIGSLEDMGYLITAYGDDRYRFGETALRAGVRAAGRPESAIEIGELPAPRPIAVDLQGRERPLSEVRLWAPRVRRVQSRLRETRR